LQAQQTAGNETDSLLKLQEQGVEQIICAIEIKSDEDADEATPAKADWAKTHFEILNQRLRAVNPVDIEESYRADVNQHYVFELLKPNDFGRWFNELTISRIIKTTEDKN
jgi:hypothetical protein